MMGGCHCPRCGADTGCQMGVCDGCHSKARLYSALLAYKLGGRKPKVKLVWPGDPGWIGPHRIGSWLITPGFEPQWVLTGFVGDPPAQQPVFHEGAD